MTNLRDLNLPCRLGCNYCTCQATNQEINEAVARKMGWNPGPLPKELEGASYIRLPPDYCHSIEAAWEIVDKYKSIPQKDWPGHTFDFQLRYYEHNPPVWSAGWFTGHIRGGDRGDSIHEEADTPSMAICLAFLKIP